MKVTDFGIARAGTSDGLTQTGSVMGTATYFSPEQAQGLPVDGRSDVYSLGIVLYEMVTGVAPFSGDSPVAVAYKHVREAPVPPSRRNPDIPPDLEQIILTAMAKEPDLRYQSADDLRADLLRFRRGRPLAAAPVTALIADTAPARRDRREPAASPRRTPRRRRRRRQTGTLAPPSHARRMRSALDRRAHLLVLAASSARSCAVVAGRRARTRARSTVPNVVGVDFADRAQKLDAGRLRRAAHERRERQDPAQPRDLAGPRRRARC